MSDINDEIGHGEYGEGVRDVPSTTRDDKGADEPGLSSTYAAGTDPEELLNGGPRPEHGIMTTTGGSAGPNSFRQPARHGPGVAPTTTGDATTGAMDTSTDAATSDATSTAID
ncbi:hypothetical protein [Actinoplanes sp. N902-109]|uniref:hypothetical protein n=1 Tax=Actinoplanes sp. (strain N902-109) TaxID=649831 RepID=UPI0003296431|nr:hypothetical protein [Actinoplanes sp. N902-109]AGL20220.1 hypothetical protein L083_6710 [Actinoplanes sp. N902-109]